MRFTCAARTDVGVVRSGNEDNYLMLADRGLFIVADGMGGHDGGEIASKRSLTVLDAERFAAIHTLDIPIITDWTRRLQFDPCNALKLTHLEPDFPVV